MTILISDNSPRISYTATSGQTAFTVPFEFFDNTDLNVYINDTLQTLTTHYTVTGGSGSTGSITLVTGATAGDIVVITRDVTLERTTDFPTSGPFQVASLNTELDKVVAMIADMKDLADRGLRLSDSDTSATLVLANKDTRKGTVLAFNETTGAVEVGPTIADTNTIAQIKADIALLADIQDGTVATNAITTVSSISSDVTTVSSNNANVTTVAGQTTNMQNITDNLTAVQNAATNATNAAASATAAAASAASASFSEAGANTSETNAATSATNASNSASAASTSASAASTSATAAASSATAAAASETAAGTSETNAATSATNAATSATNAGTSETNAASSATAAAASATSASNAQTAAESARDSALAAYDNFDDRYLGAKTSDPTVDNDGNALVAGALYFNSTDGEMKVYNGTSWVDAYADGASLVSKSGDTMTGNLSFSDDVKAIFGASSDLQIFHNSPNGNSIIKEQGGGILSLQTNGNEIALYDTANGANMSRFITGGAVQLYHNGSTKISTSAGGANVTGGINVATDGTGLALDSSSNAYMVIDRGASNRRGELVFTTASTSVLNAPPLSATTDWALGVSDSDELAGDAFYISTQSGATAAKMVITRSGDVGIGTSSPATLLDVKSSGTSAETVAQFGNNNIQGGLQVQTNGNLDWGFNALNTRNLTFSTNQTERMRIDSSGNVGIGTSSPSYNLDVSKSISGAAVIGRVRNTSSTSGANAQLKLEASGNNFTITNYPDADTANANRTEFVSTASNSYFSFSTNNSERMRLEADGDLHVDGNVVAYSTTISDIRLKKDIAPIEDAVTKVQQLNGCTFTYLKDDRKSAGLIAQDVEKVLPSAVIDDEAVFHGEEGETYKTVQYDQLIGLLVEAVKELSAKVEKLENAPSK